MRTFWKAFILSSIFFFVAIFLGSYSYLKINDRKINADIDIIEHQRVKDENIEKPKEEKNYISLKEAFDDSDRINMIVLGMEDVRTDTIILASFEPIKKKVDLISIPRDTYIHRKGYDQAEERKINSIYGAHGVEGVKKAVSHILEGVPIHHYIMVDW